jgi:UDP-sugar pyrophosphorylase
MPDDKTKQLEEALSEVTPEQKKLLLDLCQNYNQDHLLASDDFLQASASDRQKLADQLESLDKEYAEGGLRGYVKNAQKLLKDSKEGVNPLEDWEPSVPSDGATVEFNTQQYHDLEKKGLEQLGSVGFVLVAGGLGERLGYSGIKVS